MFKGILSQSSMRTTDEAWLFPEPLCHAHPPQPQHSRLREAQFIFSQSLSGCKILLFHKINVIFYFLVDLHGH